MGEWILKSAPGYTPPAAAPNVTATCTIVLQMVGNAVMAALSGSVNVPSALGTLDHVDVYLLNAASGTGKALLAFTLDKALLAASARTLPRYRRLRPITPCRE